MKEVDGGNFRTRTYYYRRCKMVRWSAVESIPDELLFGILLRLHAQDIYFGARLVYRNWYNTTQNQYFIQKHLEHAIYGLLYSERTSKELVFISPKKDNGGIDTYKLNYKIIEFSFWSSCNGLMLERVGNFFYVTNVSTGQAFPLPQWPLIFKRYARYAFCVLGYDVASMTYKVFISPLDIVNEEYAYGIITVGVDKSWRCVRINHLPSLAEESFRNYPIVAEGFLVWIDDRGTKVVTLDLETETIVETSPPVALFEKEKHLWPPSVLFEEEMNEWPICCLSTGRYITYFLRRGHLQWEIFEMKPKTAEWKKISNICLKGQKDRIEMLGFNFQKDVIDIKPCGWLKYPEVLALMVEGRHIFMIFYNFITCEINASLPINTFYMDVTLHKSSLVRLDEAF